MIDTNYEMLKSVLVGTYIHTYGTTTEEIISKGIKHAELQSSVEKRIFLQKIINRTLNHFSRDVSQIFKPGMSVVIIRSHHRQFRSIVEEI